MEPDQIDMMDAEELRVELSRMLRCAENWKRCAAAWREIDRLHRHGASDMAERARVRAQTAEDCAADLLHNAERIHSGVRDTKPEPASTPLDAATCSPLDYKKLYETECKDHAFMRKTLDMVIRERDTAMGCVRVFCREQKWAAQSWKDQPHIKALFDLENIVINPPVPR